MGNRSLIEFNHDYCPRNAEEAQRLGLALMAYMRAADPAELPPGVERKHYRHHSDPCPVEALAVIAGGDGDAHEIARQTLRR